MTSQPLLASSRWEQNTKIHHLLGNKLDGFITSAAQTAPLSLRSETKGILHRSLTSTLLLFPVFDSNDSYAWISWTIMCSGKPVRGRLIVGPMAIKEKYCSICFNRCFFRKHFNPCHKTRFSGFFCFHSVSHTQAYQVPVTLIKVP